MTRAFAAPAALPSAAASAGANASLCSRRRAPARTARPTRARAATPRMGLETAWPAFAAGLAAGGDAPAVAEWDALLRAGRDAGDAPAAAIWVLDRMREAGRRPTAATYEILLEVCLKVDDRAAAFLLVEKMWEDKVLLGDVTLPDSMEKTLRAILPPEAFD
jgi:hypothetical protein